mmetsp:Transcript_20392/g.33759  ORF Transcript_20392/g.33759 Transcript_20392/m.33759 type:complete len:259 (+) Transcript_20392:81-857(+)
MSSEDPVQPVEETPVVVGDEQQPSEEPAAVVEDAEEVSALRDNIARKGRNAYYFAHDKAPTGPKWDGKQEPKLLGKSKRDMGNSSARASMSSSFDMHKSSITTYSFSDGTKSVKLYIDYKVIVGEEALKKPEEDTPTIEEVVFAPADDEAAAASEETPKEEETPTEETEPPAPPVLTEDDIRLDYTEQSLSLIIDVPSADGSLQCQSLIFTKLAGNISSATFKLKPDDNLLVLILKKAQIGEEWRTINDKGSPDNKVV